MRVYEKTKRRTKKKKKKSKKRRVKSPSQRKMDRLRKSPAWARWREAVYTRDNYTCQLCGKKRTYLNPHHIMMKVRYPKLVFVIDNGVTLCSRCHRFTPGLHNGDTEMIDKLSRIVQRNKKEQLNGLNRRITSTRRRK